MCREEAEVVRTIVSAAGIPGSEALLEDLRGAFVSYVSARNANVRVTASREGCGLPDGPFPARARELAWWDDGEPEAWPTPEEMDVESDTGV